MPSLKELVEGFGPGFPGIDELFNLAPTEQELAALNSPVPAQGRYRGNTEFLSKITSGRSLGRLRFHVMREYFIALSQLLSNYSGMFKNYKVVRHLTPEEIGKIREIGNTDKEIIQAEKGETFTEHDTAAAGDYFKMRISKELPALEASVEGIHFANTSEDVMGNVFGLMANKLIYGALLPNILTFCDSIMLYVEQCEQNGPLVIPGLTHEQAAEPTTLGKKLMTRLKAIDYLIQRMLDEKGEFIPFSGKLGGAIGNLSTHYAAYPDINWRDFARSFVESLGLRYEELTDQSVAYVVEAQHFTTIANILSQIIKLIDDFISLASCPGQLFVKQKKKGTKGSSIMPNKSNAWAMEGAIKMLAESRDGLFSLAKELPAYPHEGNMGRSYLLRNIAQSFIPIFIALSRIGRELRSYQPNHKKINAFFSEYPGMSGSCLQTILKRAAIKGDAYRTIEAISINPDGTYANNEQFRAGLHNVIEKLDIPQEVRSELLACTEPARLVQAAHLMAQENKVLLKERYQEYRKQLEKYAV